TKPVGVSHSPILLKSIMNVVCGKSSSNVTVVLSSLLLLLSLVVDAGPHDTTVALLVATNPIAPIILNNFFILNILLLNIFRNLTNDILVIHLTSIFIVPPPRRKFNGGKIIPLF